VLRAKVRRPQLLHLMVTRLGMRDQRSPLWTTVGRASGGLSLSVHSSALARAVLLHG
jgi:hypothetical protein